MPTEAPRVRRSSLAAILLVGFVDLASFGLIIPLQADYAKRLNVSGFYFGLLIGVYAAAQFVFAPLLGRLSDRIGRRPVLLISIAGSIASHSLLGVADIVRSYPLLFLARMVDGVTGANVATAQAYIADVTTQENRARGMGLFGAAFGLGFIVGPSLGGALFWIGHSVTGGGTSWPAFGAAVLSTIAFALVLVYLPESRPASERTHVEPHGFSVRRLARVWHRPRLRELLTLLFTMVFAFVLLETTYVYLVKDRLGFGTAKVSLLFAGIGVVNVIVQGGLVGRLAKRFGEPAVINVAPVLLAAGFFGLSMLPRLDGHAAALTCLLVSSAIVAAGSGLLNPSTQSLISRQAGAGDQGGTLGVGQGLASLARAACPPIAGVLYDTRPELPYWVGVALYLAIIAFASAIRPAQQRAIAQYNEEFGPQPEKQTAADANV